MKFWHFNSMNSPEYIWEGYRNWLVNSCSWIWNFKATIIYFDHVHTSVLLSSNCQNPVWIHDHCSDASCKMYWQSISEIDSLGYSIRRKLLNCKHVHHNLSIQYASKCCAKGNWLHVLWDKAFPEVLRSLILRCLTGSLMTILSKSWYCVRLMSTWKWLTPSHFNSVFGKYTSSTNGDFLSE